MEDEVVVQANGGGKGQAPLSTAYDEGGMMELHLPKVPHPFQASLYGDMVRSGFAKLYQDHVLRATSDIVLIIGSEHIPAHKIVLCVWSDKFDITTKELVLDVDDSDTDNFKLMLRHMYTGDTDFINKDNIMALIRLCYDFGIDTLKETCGELLGALVSDDNVIDLLEIVGKYKVKQLEAACGEHLAENFGTLLAEGRLIDDLKPSTWAEMLRSDDLRIKSEEQLFEAVLRYANTRFKNDKDQRDQALSTILPFVRFPFLSPKFIMKSVEGDKTIADLPVVHDLLHETYRYKVYPASVKTIRTRPRKGFGFDTEQTANGLLLSEDKTKVTLNSGGTWCTARSMHPLTPDFDYCEFKIDNGLVSQVMVGLVFGTCVTTGDPGQYPNCWRYAGSGQINHSNFTLPSAGQQYTTGDVIGMHLDFAKGVVTFYKNGVLSCHATDVLQGNEKESAYPLVSLSSALNSISLVPRPVYPEALQATLGKKKKNRSPKTYSVGNDLDGTSSGREDEVSSSGSKDEPPLKPSDPTAFIKRFLKF